MAARIIFLWLGAIVIGIVCGVRVKGRRRAILWTVALSGIWGFIWGWYVIFPLWWGRH